VKQGGQRNRGLFSGMLRGVSDPREGSKVLTFLFRSRRVYNSLLHLLSSWMGRSPEFGSSRSTNHERIICLAPVDRPKAMPSVGR
jgi:hypothetical protein